MGKQKDKHKILITSFVASLGIIGIQFWLSF